MCSCRMCHREAGRPRRLMPTVERLMGMWCGCCGFVRYVKRPKWSGMSRDLLFCHPVKWPLSGDLDLQPTPWSCMHCQSLPVLSLHWHAPLTFLEPLLPQDSPTAHPACSTPIPGASASSNVHPMRLACSLIPGASALHCLIPMHPLCISHTQPSLQLRGLCNCCHPCWWHPSRGCLGFCWCCCVHLHWNVLHASIKRV